MIGMVGMYVSEMNKTQTVVIIISKGKKGYAVVQQGIWTIIINQELRELYKISTYSQILEGRAWNVLDM